MGREIEHFPTQIEPLSRTRLILQPWHMELARLLVSGMKKSEAARILGITEASVTRIEKNPLYQAHYQNLQQQADFAAVDVRERIRALQPRCFQIIQKFLSREAGVDDVNEPKQFDRAVKILEMGYRELSPNHPTGGISISGENVQVNVTPPEEMEDEELDRALERQLKVLVEG